MAGFGAWQVIHPENWYFALHAPANVAWTPNRRYVLERLTLVLCPLASPQVACEVGDGRGRGDGKIGENWPNNVWRGRRGRHVAQTSSQAYATQRRKALAEMVLSTTRPPTPALAMVRRRCRSRAHACSASLIELTIGWPRRLSEVLRISASPDVDSISQRSA